MGKQPHARADLLARHPGGNAGLNSPTRARISRLARSHPGQPYSARARISQMVPAPLRARGFPYTSLTGERQHTPSSARARMAQASPHARGSPSAAARLYPHAVVSPRVRSQQQQPDPLRHGRPHDTTRTSPAGDHPRPARGAGRRPQRRAAHRRAPPGRTAPHPRRPRLGEDPRHLPPHRLARPLRDRAGREHPRRHLHEQGRQRDARAGRPPHRQPRPRPAANHLPLLLRPHAARRRRGHRRGPGLRGLRRSRPDQGGRGSRSTSSTTTGTPSRRAISSAASATGRTGC